MVCVSEKVLFLHFESRDIASVEVRNIMISLVVTPMSAFCVSRYSFFNKYVASHKLHDALESANLVIKESKEHSIKNSDHKPPINSNGDNEEEVDLKQQELETEQEALFVLDDSLAKSKPFDMRDMEDVLELIVPTFVLWNINVYLLTAGLYYAYFYAVLFIVTMVLVIWHKFSKNIGLITPILLPLTCVGLEFFAFVFVATWSLIWYHQSPTAALVIGPLIGFSIWSLFWKKEGVLKLKEELEKKKEG